MGTRESYFKVTDILLPSHCSLEKHFTALEGLQNQVTKRLRKLWGLVPWPGLWYLIQLFQASLGRSLTSVITQVLSHSGKNNCLWSITNDGFCAVAFWHGSAGAEQRQKSESCRSRGWRQRERWHSCWRLCHWGRVVWTGH